jgi:DNA-binding transcriptional ArsR family regulator
MENIVTLLKALSDENRIKILQLLLKYDFCVRALSERLAISEAAVSQHLKILREADIIYGEKIGYFTHYHVKKDTLSHVSDYFSDLSDMQK